jgi:uncharacterized membrane protein YedE/YeeE
MLDACFVLLVLATGYATQRGDICAVTAVAELVCRCRAQRFLGFLFCAACSLLVISGSELLGQDVIARRVGFPATVSTALGGAIYGAGIFINGRCAFGTAARLSRGELPRLATVAGFFVGAAFTRTPATPLRPVASLLLAWQDNARFITALAVAITLGWWLATTTPHRSENQHWTLVGAMSAFGLLVGCLTVLPGDRAYTPLFIEAGSGPTLSLLRHHALALVFLSGACAAAITTGLFRVERGSGGDWARATIGGAIMGVGARLVPGGNEAMLFIGLPLLLPNLLVAYGTMNAVLIVLTRAAMPEAIPVKR